MFTAVRVVNGIFSLILLGVLTILLLWGGSVSHSTFTQLVLIPIFFLSDLIFREKNAFSDLVYTTLWMIYFLCTVLLSVIGYIMEVHAPAIGGTLFLMLMATTYGVPFLFNGMYFARLMKRQKSVT